MEGSGNLLLICPSCGHEYTHHDVVVIHERAEDAQTTDIIVKTWEEPGFVKPQNPSARRNAVTVGGSCEGCDARWELVIAQHKGRTGIAIRPADTAPAPEREVYPGERRTFPKAHDQ